MAQFKPKTFKGIKKKNLEKKNFGDGAIVPKEGMLSVQFLEDPEDWEEYYQHVFQEEGKWRFVPCTMDDTCPLCDSESDRARKQSYAFACNVINLDEKKVQILTGPKDLAARLFDRYEKSENSKEGLFRRRVWDLTRASGSGATTYDVDRSEKRPINPAGFKLLDVSKFLADQMVRYYGEEKSPQNIKALEDDSVEDSWEDDDNWLDEEGFDPQDDFDSFDEPDDEDDFPEEFEEEVKETKPKRGRPKKGA